MQDLDRLITLWQEVAPLVASGAALLSVLLLLFVLLRLRRISIAGPIQALTTKLAFIEEAHQRLERSLREEFRGAREENIGQARHSREEVANNIKVFGDSVGTNMTEMANLQRERFEAFALGLAQNHDTLVKIVGEMRSEMFRVLEGHRLQHNASQVALQEQVSKTLTSFGEANRGQMAQLLEIQRNQHDSFQRRVIEMAEANSKAGETLRQAVEAQLTAIRTDNSAKLELMRAAVEEKLQGTLEQRLGESFKLVGDRLEAVHKGLGEMQTLATGVGDLKRVLTNVKARGTWGEVQLGAILEQILSPGQYTANATTSPDSADRVEYAIRLPGPEDGSEVLLPIDAKFPVEDYERLQHAAEVGDAAGVELAAKGLETRIRNSARDICAKYVHPPQTTDFAILFLPTEGLYAEVLRRPGLCDDLQRNNRVVVAGPTTLTAIVNSLQMGFRTLAIQKRSGEVWRVLGAVKTEFGKFGPILGKVQKKLQEASNHMDGVGRRERALQRKLNEVVALPVHEAQALIGFAGTEMDEDESEEALSPA